MSKPNCYECKHRRDIQGDAHSRCAHPFVDVDDNPLGAMVDVLAGKTRDAAMRLQIVGHPRGVARGWFLWPANYDPVWLESCEGFEKGA